jgi:hypothetical protein
VGNVRRGPELGPGGSEGGLAGGLDGGLEGGLDGGFDEGGLMGVEGELPVADEFDAVRALQPSKPLNSVPAAIERNKSPRRSCAKLRCERLNGVPAAEAAIAKARMELKSFVQEIGFEAWTWPSRSPTGLAACEQRYLNK